MTEQSAFPLIVLSPARDPAEAINGMLRRAGQPVYCTWIPALRDVGDALAQLNPELLICVSAGAEELQSVIRVRDQLAPTVPVLVLAAAVDETSIAAALRAGARDVVTLANEARLQAVVLRELKVFRTARALDATLKSASDARNQLDNVLQRSNDAIIQVQEGIVIEANPSWLELFGFEDDSRRPAGHGSVRGCHARGAARGTGGLPAGPLERRSPAAANALLADGTVLPIEIALALGEHDGEPCVRLVVPSRPHEARSSRRRRRWLRAANRAPASCAAVSCCRP